MRVQTKSVTFTKETTLHLRQGTFCVGRGETVGIPQALAAEMIRTGAAVEPGDPLDPPQPDETPTRIRLLASYREPTGAHHATGEHLVVPAHVANRLVRAHIAQPHDGSPDPTTAESPIRSRIRARLRQRADALMSEVRA